MKDHKFKVALHEEYGTLGFKPLWYPGDPLSGMAVAHDILEHFPGDTGSREEELEALGVALLLRGDTRYFNRLPGRNYTPEENLSTDMYQVLSYSSVPIRSVPKVRDPELLIRCRRVLKHAKENDGEDKFSEHDSEMMARWLARGYMRGKNRYRRVDLHTVAYHIFKGIEEEADRLLKRSDEGMILTVSVNLRGMNYRLACDYPMEDYQ